MTFNPGPFLRQAWSVYAQAFAAEAGELSINHRSFSLPKFISFLANHGSDSPAGQMEPSSRHYEPHPNSNWNSNSNRTRRRTRTGTVTPVSSGTSGVRTASRSRSIHFSMASDANAQNPVLHHY